MPDNPNVVALLKEFKNEASLTRSEAGRIIGKSRDQTAGICNRHDIKPWPPVPKQVFKNRSCQFPMGHPGEDDFHLCGKRRDIGHSLCCAEHRDKQWVPECKVISMGK